MHGYTKLFNSILHSTIWSEPNEIRILWITMLAMADKYGDIHASIPGLARMAGVTVEQCQDGLKCFLSPDSYSRTPDHEGRRIREIEGGWQLLNHGKYRALMSVEERKEYNRVKQAERRAKISATNCQKMSNSVADLSMTVNDNQQCQHITEADTEAKAINTECLAVVDSWNLLPDLFPKIQKLSEGRKKTLRARLKDDWWVQNYNGALKLIIESQFLSGKNDREWIADFDWFIKPDSVVKIIEGKYQKNGSHTQEPLRNLNSYTPK